MIDGENTIVCCDYAADYEPISIVLSYFGLKCSSLTGKKNTNNEKSNLLKYEERKHRRPRRHKSVWSWSQNTRHPACYTHEDSPKLIVLGSGIRSRWTRWPSGAQLCHAMRISKYEKIPVLDNIWFATENRNPS
jgi:hypothetical protein